MSNRHASDITPDDYRDSPDYRASFEEWMGAHNGTSPEHLTAGQVASIGFVPTAIHDPGQTTGEEWAEYVWNELDGDTRYRLMDHLIEVMADIFEALPGYQVAADEWAAEQWEDRDLARAHEWAARRRQAMVEA